MFCKISGNSLVFIPSFRILEWILSLKLSNEGIGMDQHLVIVYCTGAQLAMALVSLASSNILPKEQQPPSFRLGKQWDACSL